MNAHPSASSDSRHGARGRMAMMLACCLLPLALTAAHAQRVDVSGTETGKPQPRLPTIVLKVGGQSVKAEVAADDTTRQTGMMFRTKMGANEGMLFVFPQPAYYAMWMRNTLIPLAVAYIDDAGRIVSIHEMMPRTDTSHQAAAPARYALEMNGGWFARHKIKVGDTVQGLDKAPKSK